MSFNYNRLYSSVCCLVMFRSAIRIRISKAINVCGQEKTTHTQSASQAANLQLSVSMFRHHLNVARHTITGPGPQCKCKYTSAPRISSIRIHHFNGYRFSPHRIGNHLRFFGASESQRGGEGRGDREFICRI